MTRLVEQKAYQQAVAAIYDAAVSADNWNAALSHIAKLFQSQTAALIIRDLATMTGSAVNVGSDAAAVREYFSVWRHRNILVNNTRAWRETDRHMVARDRLIRSDYFNEYMKHYDADRVLRLSLLTEAGVPEGQAERAGDGDPCSQLCRHRRPLQRSEIGDVLTDPEVERRE